MLRTIEDILGLEHMSVHDAGVRPMTDVFDIDQGANWTYKAVPSRLLPLATQLPIAQQARLGKSPAVRLAHDGAWWAAKTKGFTFVKEDANNAAAYNRVLWEGTMGDRPYPTKRSGLDLRHDRAKLLKIAAVPRQTTQSSQRAD
jgi:hypothetical protein